jgi:membrane protein CcdC involved in cytochrome C biogenesis
MTTQSVAVVPVVSAWWSKVNWTQALGAVTSLVVASGIDIPADKKAIVLTGITLAQGALTWVFRTFFNGSVNPASLPK